MVCADSKRLKYGERIPVHVFPCTYSHALMGFLVFRLFKNRSDGIGLAPCSHCTVSAHPSVYNRGHDTDAPQTHFGY